MKILLTNDDGWDAPGLETLRSVAAKFGEVWTVAPTHPMSGISHQVTFDRPLQLMQTAEREYSLDGTPADCVRIGLTQLDIQFDWVLSGINNGANLGADVYVSGTVAAARESSLRGVRAIALSQHRLKFKLDFDWSETGLVAEKVLVELLRRREVQIGEAINVNLPDRYHFPGEPNCLSTLKIVECKIDSHPLPTDYQIDEEGRFYYQGKYKNRPQMPGGDLEACFAGCVTCSVLKLH